MSGPDPGLSVSRCESCHGRFLPRPGGCPRCGSASVRSERLPGTGVVLAATELMSPSEGWSSPHRLALVEATDQVRVLALVEGPLPRTGALVSVRQVGDRYVARPASS